MTNNFIDQVEKTRTYHAFSSPGLMLATLKFVRGYIVMDVGYGGGLFSHIARIGWNMSESYQKGNITRDPYLIGLDINKWLDKYNHNYDLILQGTSSDLLVPDKSIDTLVCIENVEHLTDKEFHQAIDEFERVTRYRILITTPSPLSFLGKQTFLQRAYLLPRSEIHLDKFIYATLASAIHRKCIDPQFMREKGYSISVFNGEGYPNHPIYIKDMEPWAQNQEEPLNQKIFEKISTTEYSIDIDDYIASLNREYPLDKDTIRKYARIKIEQLNDAIMEDTQTNNFRIRYLNHVCASLWENDTIDQKSRRYYRKFLINNYLLNIRPLIKRKLQAIRRFIWI